MDDSQEESGVRPDDESNANDSASDDEGSGSEQEEEMEDDECEEDSAASEYSYYQSEDDEEEGECDVVPPARAAAASAGPAAFAGAGAKRKAKDPLAELDQILHECNNAFPEAFNHSQHDDKKPPATDARKAQKTDATSTELSETDASPTTSTLKAGIGYETGTYNADTSSMIEKNMSGAAERQRELDDLCLPLISRLLGFIKGFNGLFGMVLLALKLSPGFNRLLFSLLLNDSLLDWGKRKRVYDATLDLLDTFSSQFYVGILLHNLLEGDGTSDNGTSNCQALLEIVHTKAVIMIRSQQKMKSASPSDEAVAKNTRELCQKIIATHEKVNAAIRSGRETGIIADPDRELTSKDMVAGHPHLPGADNDEAPPPTEREEVAAYIEGMKKHRLRHVALLEAARQDAHYDYLAEATRTSADRAVKKNRMFRIAGEIAGLSTDLPCEWSSGIYVVVDEDRPDVLKACVVAPEGTPYENGCFEFDVYLPLTYPDNPPKVNLCTTAYKSVRFNPNLYNDGKVCLSLLGTWEGPGWIPDTSTLYQVLLSIQSLIFVPDPFFNEPGYSENHASQQKQSQEYNRQVRAATLKVAILGQMKKPSPLFLDCINDHFRLKKRRILKQLEEWEELERQAAQVNKPGVPHPPSAAGAANAVGYGTLVAGGGILSSVKIVKGFCDKIRDHIEKTWPDRKGKGDGAGGDGDGG